LCEQTPLCFLGGSAAKAGARSLTPQIEQPPRLFLSTSSGGGPLTPCTSTLKLHLCNDASAGGTLNRSRAYPYPRFELLAAASEAASKTLRCKSISLVAMFGAASSWKH